MKDRIRYSEAFKLKVMEELRDAKWKSVQEAARAYGIAEMSVYNWIHKLGFEHLKGRLIYVKTRTELDRIKELEEQVLRLKQSLADEVLDHKIDVEFLKIACQRAGTSVEDLTRLSTFALTANFFRGETPRDGVVCRESSRIASRNAV